MISETAYYPFGRPRYQQAADGKGSFYTYTGKELDNTGLFYYEARYMDPVIGRFISVDPLFVDIGNIDKHYTSRYLFNPQEGNIYSYGLNNPTVNTDPSGKAVPAVIGLCAVSAPCVALAAGTATLVGKALYNTYEAIADHMSQSAESSDSVKSGSGVQSRNTVNSDNDGNGFVMYHYTNVSPDKWRGSTLPMNQFVTPHYFTESDTAIKKLGLKQNYGTKMYRYAVHIPSLDALRPNEFSDPGNIARPTPHEGTDYYEGEYPKRPGGAVEFITNRETEILYRDPIE